MRRCVVDITELTNPCITRNRGKEAAEKLSNYVGSCLVDINLNNADVISLSFLDELIHHYTKAVDNGHITFSTTNKSVEAKLSRIAAVRSVTIHCRGLNRKEYIIPTRQYDMPTPVFMHSKTI